MSGVLGNTPTELLEFGRKFFLQNILVFLCKIYIQIVIASMTQYNYIRSKSKPSGFFFLHNIFIFFLILVDGVYGFSSTESLNFLLSSTRTSQNNFLGRRMYACHMTSPSNYDQQSRFLTFYCPTQNDIIDADLNNNISKIQYH